MVATVWVLVLGVSGRAFEQNQFATDLLRAHFTDDGDLSFPIIDDIVQTHDGFLWLISNGSSVIRFDGKNFYSFDEAQPRTLAVGPDGDLWIGTTYEGLVRIPAASLSRSTFTGAVTYHPGPGKASQIIKLCFSRNGVLWVGTVDGLFRYEQDQFVPVGPRTRTRQINETPDGRILVTTGEGFLELVGSEVVAHSQLPSELKVKEINEVLIDHHGVAWYLTALGVARELNGRLETLGTYAEGGHSALHACEDQQGTLWIAKDEGLFRFTSNGLESVAAGLQLRNLYCDRDGQLWVATNGDGVYRFRERVVHMFTKEDGLPNNVLMTVLVAHDGTVWTGANCGGISRFDGTRFQTLSEKDGLLNSCVWSLAEDANHDLWIGTWGGGAFRYHNGAFTQYSKSQGLGDVVLSIVAAHDGSIWFATHDGVSRLKDGRFTNFTVADGLSSNKIVKIYEDHAGVIWVGTPWGLDRLVGDRFESVSSLAKMLVIPVGEARDGGLYVSVEEGPDLRLHRLANARDDITKEIGPYDLIETEQGELWLCGAGGTIRVLPGKLAQSRRQDEPLDYETFSTNDGMAAAASSQGTRSLALTRNGEIWAATVKGAAVFDLSRVSMTHTTPSIYLKSMTVGRNTQPVGSSIVLAPGNNHIQINFQAIELFSPEKIQLQYRLDGVDSEWLDAGTDPHAIYSTLPVGTHVLRIRACNRNGIWDRQGVAFTITQQPFFYQTRWFIAVMFALGVALLAAVYHLRVRQISRQMTALFDERLAERTRVARELHDTLMQTVQGSKLVAEHALKNPADHNRVVRALEQLAQWLTQATEEGRAALNSLRSAGMEKNNLVEAFRRAIDECGRDSSAEISFSVIGDATEVHPVVRDEIYRIGYEAIRNACAHSGAGRLEVTLEYAHDFTLRVSDNGVGVDSEIVEQGKEGHFGLRGMRERAERIGGKFSLVSAPNSGTVITLVVPGRMAFRSATSK